MFSKIVAKFRHICLCLVAWILLEPSSPRYFKNGCLTHFLALLYVCLPDSRSNIIYKTLVPLRKS